ncbi:MAG: hypothetical protein UT48_C0024G0006 [Parcubacteria group bacterium GW2011_GWE2_39_37]|nr:MAG: hypothetical protein UT48_C0024G0006 [Parcubacteria group bacterium GW2011_GWE2_39_37]
MPKYILNSGGLRNEPEKSRLFFIEIVKGLGETPKILFCFFAEKREVWEEKFETYKKHFSELAIDIAPTFELAFPDKFIEQMKNNDAVIIFGGDDHLVMYWLGQYNLYEICKSKVVATSSAGTNALVKHFWTCDWRKCFDGLGILPIKFIAHYESDYGNNDPRGPIDWQKGYNELAEYGDTSLPIHALEEGKFIVIEK